MNAQQKTRKQDHRWVWLERCTGSSVIQYTAHRRQQLRTANCWRRTRKRTRLCSSSSVIQYRRTTNLACGGTFFSTTPYSPNQLTNFFTWNNFGYLEAIQMAPAWRFLSFHFYPLQMITFCPPLNHPRGPKNRIIGGVKSGNSKIATVAPFVLPQGIQNSSK